MKIIAFLALILYLIVKGNAWYTWVFYLFVAFCIYLVVASFEYNREEEAEAKEKKTSNAFKVNAKLKIKYKDGNGSSSERKIHAFAYEDGNPGVIAARCMLRNADRSFRTDRIFEAVDLETGEVINSKKLPSFFRKKKI
ncbi:hypothetical protein ACO0K2_04245 [Undibacterium sp. MH2W]|uniref:hypothetical protein n=1 Tax=Undibacterium sp. MH2W TaxID=3413044 RepID=UPI003BF026AC